MLIVSLSKTLRRSVLSTSNLSINEVLIFRGVKSKNLVSFWGFCYISFQFQ